MKIPERPPDWVDITPDEPGRLGELFASGIARHPPTKYLHWDELRRRSPPDGFTLNEWWLAKKLARTAAWRPLPFLDKNEEPFVFGVTDNIQEMLHRIDQQASGSFEAAPNVVSDPSTRDRYRISSLMEEAITSSQLEGASTTHRVAKQMLRGGRKPADTSERMIFNNYLAMEFIREVRSEPLSLENVLELHRIVTDGTLDKADAEGRLRRADEQVLVVDERDNQILHEPPHAEELPERLERFIQFANEQLPGDGFIHPVIRSVLVHFMIGYDHPFYDGNGRTARALFYWSMARSGYWLTEFLSISTILRRAPAQYAKAYLFTETDDNDTTYFLDYNLRVILRSVDALHEYIRKKTLEIQEVENLLETSKLRYELNHRQMAVVSNALRKSGGGSYTIQSHMKSHNVTYQTARTDLLKLAEVGLVNQYKQGRSFLFQAVPEIESVIRELTSAATSL